MKKTLVTLAALAATSVATAAGENLYVSQSEGGSYNQWGNYQLSADNTEWDMSTYVWETTADNGDLNNTGKIYINGKTGNKLNVEDKVEINTIVGGGKIEKTGTGTLVLAHAASDDRPDEVIVSAGVLKAGVENAIEGWGVTLDGTTLELAANQNLGNGRHSDWGSNDAISLKNGATIDGAGKTLTFMGATIKAEGEGNTINADVVANWNATFAVDAKSDLTLEGALAVADDSAGNVYKTGDGTLTLSKVSSAAHINLEGGILDLSAVSSLGSLNASDDTTIKIGGSELNFNGALTLGSGVTLDLTEWTGTLGDAFSGVTSLTATSPVTVLLADGSTQQMTLTMQNGSVSIPEPATATLSLLALAGLAARRRRK